MLRFFQRRCLPQGAVVQLYMAVYFCYLVKSDLLVQCTDVLQRTLEKKTFYEVSENTAMLYGSVL